MRRKSAGQSGSIRGRRRRYHANRAHPADAGRRDDLRRSAGVGPSIVDAAAEQGIELPFSCKGGVCATCRTHLRKGKVDMAANYGLEPWEVEQGFVLACQSTPMSDELLLDYDKT